MKKLCLLLAVLTVFSLSACGNKEKKGELTLSAAHTKNGYSASAVLDGNVNVGWIGGKKATEANFQTFDIDFGEEKTFTKITLDDTFADGYTNRRPDYIRTQVSYQTGNVSTVGEGSALANVLSGGADGLSWKSEAVPSADAPQWLWISLSADATVKKIELNNEMNNSVPVNYELYYSSTAHSSRKQQDGSYAYLDTSTYTLLATDNDNEENIVEHEVDEAITVRDVLIKVYSQQNEGADVVASLDEIMFYGETPADYHEEHQPVQFTFMGSNDGKVYEIITEVNGNYDSVWTFTATAELSYRYIRYIVFSEYNNNYPSIGELKFE
ncbi:MAG: hypothetical protein IKC36_01585 [Clostridia bacterium]|nr:hypothetical protein [Clostridia bacterium]